ncbi:unnamed protein product [Ectocarpus sp. 8 AP-2014]
MATINNNNAAHVLWCAMSSSSIRGVCSAFTKRHPSTRIKKIKRQEKYLHLRSSNEDISGIFPIQLGNAPRSKSSSSVFHFKNAGHSRRERTSSPIKRATSPQPKILRIARENMVLHGGMFALMNLLTPSL